DELLARGGDALRVVCRAHRVRAVELVVTGGQGEDLEDVLRGDVERAGHGQVRRVISHDFNVSWQSGRFKGPCHGTVGIRTRTVRTGPEERQAGTSGNDDATGSP